MLKPLFSRVLVEREVAVKKGSILLPGNAQLKYASLRCKVVAVGPDVNDCNETMTHMSEIQSSSVSTQAVGYTKMVRRQMILIRRSIT